MREQTRSSLGAKKKVGFKEFAPKQKGFLFLRMMVVVGIS